MSCDILVSEPWACGNKDCPAQWHQANYWIDGDGYTVDRYSDGDHEEIDESDLPTFEGTEKAWQEYYKWVAAHGIDPLGALSIPRKRRRERWGVKLGLSILGVVLLQARRGAKRITRPEDLPPHVAKYLGLVKGRTLQSTAAELRECGVRLGPWHWFTLTVDGPEPTPGQINKAARRALKRQGVLP